MFRYKKFNASFVAMYINSKNSVINDVTYIGNHMFLSQSVNTRYYHNYAGRLALQLNDVAGFGASLNLELNHYEAAVANWSHNPDIVFGKYIIMVEQRSVYHQLLAHNSWKILKRLYCEFRREQRCPASAV